MHLISNSNNQMRRLITSW